MGFDPVTQDTWLTRHPYLQPMAHLNMQVVTAVRQIQTPGGAVPDWTNYVGDFHRGVPLLHSAGAAIDLMPVEEMIRSVVNVVTPSLPNKLVDEGRVLSKLLGDENATGHVLTWLLETDSFSSVCPGLLRYLGWTVLAWYLKPVVDAFAGWRDEERWLRTYCPTCGSKPTMAQLVGKDPGRRRFLSCGRCGTRWWYRRTGCPFCENSDDQRLAVLAVEGEGGLRIDYCGSCAGYLKTYDGEGSERVLLADWTSLHLDVLARDRGLTRLAGSLYEL